MDPNENKNYPPENESFGEQKEQNDAQLPAGSQSQPYQPPQYQPPQYQPPQYGGSSSYQQQSYGQQPYQAPQYQPQSYQAPNYQSQPYQQSQQPYQAQPYQAMPYEMQDLPKRSSGLAIASMVCGILSVVFCCGMWLSWILSVVAIVLGIVSISKRQGGRGMAIAGIITAAFGLLLSIGFLVFAYAVGEAGNALGPGYYDYYDDIF